MVASKVNLVNELEPGVQWVKDLSWVCAEACIINHVHLSPFPEPVPYPRTPPCHNSLAQEATMVPCCYHIRSKPWLQTPP